ncbi:hypothetical protein DYB37_003744 [Aphanomyces astaci]|uniref:Nbr1 FW domain-containing protein n=1 Tax=Aphanomyces astaci TaxID=112090 RepID=A0A3R7EY13_APHAT|nr:hypothetical protein DYB35_001987 [Aphanomyces astaci]RHZ18406.1 hypothetical protein DYB37_003744 [Aphanomyces astaci]
MTDADDLLRMFQSITTNDHDDLVQQFSKILQCDAPTSTFFLESSNWNVETAANMYLTTTGAATLGSTDMYQMAQPEARFLSDLSAAQSALLLPLQPVQLRLSFQNVGSAPWPEHTSLVLSQGFHFNAPPQVQVESVDVGCTVDVNLSLIMPAESGTHYGNWRLMWEGGYFGDPVWVVLTVVDDKGRDLTDDGAATASMDYTVEPDCEAVMTQGEDAPFLIKGDEGFNLKHEIRELVSMAFQVSLASLVRMGLTAIDSAFLGHLGVQALAASSLASVWMAVPLYGVWSGISCLVTLCGQALGAQNYQLAGIWLQFGVIICFFMSLVSAVYYWNIGILLRMSTSDEEVVKLGIRFARIMALTIFPSLTYACMRLYFQSMSIVLPTTLVGLASVGVAVGANYMLIYGTATWPGMGFDGSPWATVIACLFQPTALYLYCVVWKKYHLRAWGGWKLDELTWERFYTFTSLGVPMAFNSFITNLASAGVAVMAAKMGPEIVAANAIVTQFWTLLYAFFWGFGCATQTKVAFYLGAGKPTSAKAVTKIGAICTIVNAVVLAAVILSLRHRIFIVYTNDESLLQLAGVAVPIFVSAYFLESLEMFMAAVLTGMGEVRVIFWTALFATWCVQLPVCYVWAFVFDAGFASLWNAVCTMEAVKLVIFAVVLARVDWDVVTDRAIQASEAKRPSKDDDETKLRHQNEQLVELSDIFNGPTMAGAPRTPLASAAVTPSSTRMRKRTLSYGAVVSDQAGHV